VLRLQLAPSSALFYIFLFLRPYRYAYLIFTIWIDALLPDLYEASIAELLHGLENGHFSSVDLVKVKFHRLTLQKAVLTSYQAYLARIEEVNLKGPELRAVLEINPQALALATTSDEVRKAKGLLGLGPLHGIPILLKDNIATLHKEGTCISGYPLI
jgi:amidase